MSLHDLERYLYRLKLDPAMQAEFMDRPIEHLAGQILDAASRQALADKDLEQLWLLGVHPMLMAPLGRLFGLTAAQYQARMRAVAGQRRISS